MLTTGTLIFWLTLALLAGAAWHWLGKCLFSDEARDRRRRQRNYGKVASRRHGPGVKLAVRLGRS